MSRRAACLCVGPPGCRPPLGLHQPPTCLLLVSNPASLSASLICPCLCAGEEKETRDGHYLYRTQGVFDKALPLQVGAGPAACPAWPACPACLAGLACCQLASQSAVAWRRHT